MANSGFKIDRDELKKINRTQDSVYSAHPEQRKVGTTDAHMSTNAIVALCTDSQVLKCIYYRTTQKSNESIHVSFRQKI